MGEDASRRNPGPDDGLALREPGDLQQRRRRDRPANQAQHAGTRLLPARRYGAACPVVLLSGRSHDQADAGDADAAGRPGRAVAGLAAQPGAGADCRLSGFQSQLPGADRRASGDAGHRVRQPSRLGGDAFLARRPPRPGPSWRRKLVAGFSRPSRSAGWRSRRRKSGRTVSATSTRHGAARHTPTSASADRTTTGARDCATCAAGATRTGVACRCCTSAPIPQAGTEPFQALIPLDKLSVARRTVPALRGRRLERPGGERELVLYGPPMPHVRKWLQGLCVDFVRARGRADRPNAVLRHLSLRAERRAGSGAFFP